MTEKKFSLLGMAKAQQEKKVVQESPAKPSLLNPSKPVAESPKAGLPAAPAVAQAAPARVSLLGGAKPSAAVSTTAPAKPAGSLLASSLRINEKREEIKKDVTFIFDEMPVDFKEMLDKFDMMLVRDTGVTTFNIDILRSYVKRIMIDLKTNPEYDGLIIDRDVRNVIQFMRAIKGRAIDAAGEKKVKAENKAKKGSAKSQFADIPGDLDFGAKPKLLPGDLKALADSDWG